MFEILKYIENKYKGQTRKNGAPSITHSISVKDVIKQKGYPVDYQYVALLHDILEDTDGTEQEILSLTNDKVLEAVILLTKEKNYNMDDYVKRIKNNDLALPVKLADRFHNLLDSIYTDKRFRHKYIEETEKYYIPLSKNTIFEQDILNALKVVKDFD